MKKIILFFVLVVPLYSSFPQNTQPDAELAYHNAMKGVYWALSNIPENKLRLTHELIAENKLVADVKLDIEINGVKISSTGYDGSTEVNIKLYRSIDSLKESGYLKNKRIKQPGNE